MSEGNQPETTRVTSRSGSLAEVAAISWPIVVSMLSYTAMGVTDTLVVGWVGTTELAAVGLATTAFFLFNSFFLGTLHSTKVLVSQATGAGQRQFGLDAVWFGMGLAIVFGAVVIALSSVDMYILELFGASAQIEGLASSYFTVRTLAAPFWFVLMVLCDGFQGTGDTRTPMWLTLIANAVNIVLDLILVFGLGPIPALGVDGAAWATVAASAVGMLLGLWRFFRRGLGDGVEQGIRPTWRPSILKDLLRVGVPIGVRYALNTVGFAVFTSFLARMGEANLAAHHIGLRIISVSFLPGYGIGEAASVLVGQYMGMNRIDLARRALINSMKLSVGVMAACGLVFLAVPELLVGLFVEDPAVIAVGRDLLFIAAIFQVFDAVAMTAIGGLNGAGDTRFTMVASIAINWFVMVPCAWGLGIALGYGAPGTWLGLTVEIVVLAAVALLRVYSGAWTTKATVTANVAA